MAKLTFLTCALSIALVVFVAISTPRVDSTWASIVYTAALLMSLGAVVAALLCEEKSRLYWRGFALCAVAYFACNWMFFDSWWLTNYLPDVKSRPVGANLPPTYVLAWTYDHFGGEEMWTGGGTRAPAMFMIRADRAAVPDYMDISAFDALMSGGHAVFTVLFGLVGGLLSVYFFRDRPQS